MPSATHSLYTTKASLRADVERLWSDIHETAEWGAVADSYGMARLALSNDDKAVRNWFIAKAREIGCEVSVDAIGNIFAVLPGTNKDLAPIAMGSHLDTQFNGGRFDGIVGVLAALEVLRTIKDSGIKTYAPIAAVNWTNEEGAGYVSGCTGSAVWSTNLSISQGHNNASTTRDSTMKEDLLSIEYLGARGADFRLNPLNAHFEVHIEQERRLQDQKKEIGVVTGIQGVRWYTVVVSGEQGHAGSTPMKDRADAHVAAAELTILVQKLALAHDAVGTVGVIRTEKSSVNKIPGYAEISIDFRHPAEAVLDEFESSMKAELVRISNGNSKFTLEMTRTWCSPVANFNDLAMECIRSAAVKEVGPDKVMEMISFAGHDSALVSRKTPTAMIFIPCRDGISHSPLEHSTKEQCGNGAQVLLHAVLNYDALLRRHDKSLGI